MADILVTGAGGFIGQTLVPLLDAESNRVIAVFRNKRAGRCPTRTQRRIYREIGPDTDWNGVLGGIDVVVHLAGIAHNVDCRADLADYKSVNVDGTYRLAIKAAEAGVRRFVFLSSIKVLGEQSRDAPFTVADDPNPRGAYAESKMEAEAALRDVARLTGIEVVIIRPPLVYGPLVKGNLAALLGMIERGMPIPLRGIRNQRDLIGVHNLCDLILTCIGHPAAAGRTFLACDGESLSTMELVQHLALGAGRRARLLYVPQWLLAILASIAGKRETYEKLSGDLRIDMEKTQRVLGWSPPYSIEECFRKSFMVD